MVLTYLVISLLVSSITLAVIKLVKKIFQNQLSAKWQYNLWFLFLIALTLPFLPKQLIDFGNFFTSLDVNLNDEISHSITSTSDTAVAENPNWMQDLTLSVNRSDLEFLNILLASIWIAGMIVMAVLTLQGWFMLMKIKSTSTVPKNKEVLRLFIHCKHRLNITGRVIVRESTFVKSPMTFGLFKTYVVLPSRVEEWMTMKEIQYIFLHELNHYKYKDIVSNYFIIIYQILYWFQPLVWMAFKEMKVDREIACDNAVLHTLEEPSYQEYGNTIINFVDKASNPKNIGLANELNGSKGQIKKRIERIASFTTESMGLKMKSVSIFLLVGVFVVSQAPLVSVMADDRSRYDFNEERTVYEDLSEYFTGYDGSFVLYDMQADKYHIHNQSKSTRRISPDSTYKIYSALFGLETGVISNDNSQIPWDGTKYPYEAWNRNQTLSSAIKHSVTWYFQKLDKKIQQDTIQAYLKQISYGNGDLSGGIEEFWLESSLKISPVEQVQLLKAFYTNAFEFDEKNIKTVKDIIKLEERNGEMLSGKTGTGTVNGENVNGWFIGYVETKENTYFFATNIQNEDNSDGSKAANITLSILYDKEIIQGIEG
ncbi:BlaR1 family beta-lactam sensor/signal transducer [Oceanobacillus picturae]|uniref:BlaR1 family beta-lactam sensor/signal transducer n=1 Tax=Oceanobacillus picturae TaxID=171693 RepID=UPI00363B32E6